MATLLREKYNTGDDGAETAGGSVHIGQYFKATQEYTTTSIKMKLYRVGSPDTITLSLYNVSGGVPTGAAIATDTYNGNSLTTDAGGEWVEFTISYSLNRIQDYAFAVSGPNVGTIKVRKQGSATTYGNGYIVQDPGTGWSTIAAADCMFEVWGSKTDVAASVVIGGIRDTTKEVSVWGLDSDGEIAWFFDTGHLAADVHRLSSGDFVIAGTTADNGQGGGSRNVWILDSFGQMKYEALIIPAGSAFRVKSDSNYLYIATSSGVFRTNHNLTGSTQVTTQTSQAVAVDTSGNIYVGGGGVPATLRKYNSSLVFQWQKDTNDSCIAIDILSDGNVIIGTTDGEVRRYESDGLSPDAGKWAYTVGTGVAQIFVAIYNDVIYAAQSNGSTGGDVFVALNTNGVRQWGILEADWSEDIEKIVFNSSGVPFWVGDWHGGFSVFEVDTINEEARGIMVQDYVAGAIAVAMDIVPTYSYAPDLSDAEAQWRMNDNANNPVVFEQAYNRNGTASKNTSAMTTAGKINTALNFVRADNDDVDLGDNAAWELTPSQDKTFAFWCNWAGTGANNFNVILAKYLHASTVGYASVIQRIPKNLRTFLWWPGGGSLSTVTTGLDLSTSGWFLTVIRIDRSGRLAVSINNGAYSSYVDISANETDDLSNSSSLMLAENLPIGVDYERFEGALDNIGIWSRILTQEEEALIWNNGAGTEAYGIVESPVITDQSTSITKSVGQAVSFFVTATGEPTPTYQWYKNSSPISGETSSTLSFTCESDSGGIYTCIVTNIGGSVTSSDIVLSVIPLITSQSGDANVLRYCTATFSVIAGGYPVLSYQWYKNGSPILGETSSSISVIADVSTIGTYACKVTNVVGSSWSNNMELSVSENPYRYRIFDLPLDSDRVC
jgi:hypothetical protein